MSERIVLRPVTYMIREEPEGVPWPTPQEEVLVPVTGWTAEVLGAFAVRADDRNETVPPGTWKVDHVPSGYYAITASSEAEAVREALRYARATVDGRPVDWSAGRYPPALRARLRLPLVGPVEVVHAEGAAEMAP